MKVPAIFICILTGFFSVITNAQETCPKEKINCTHHCRKYIDENKNDTCDLSEAYIKSLLQKSIAQQPKIPELPKPDSVIQIPQKEKAVEVIPANSINKVEEKKVAATDKKNPGSIKYLSVQPVDTNTTMRSIAVQNKADRNSNPDKKETPPYHFITMSAITLLGYMVSMIFVAIHAIKKSIHRKFWNLVLLFSFLISGLLGIFLVVQVNYDLHIKNLTLYYVLHVDVGIIMAILSLIHFYWHWKYYYGMFKK